MFIQISGGLCDKCKNKDPMCYGQPYCFEHKRDCLIKQEVVVRCSEFKKK